jgi:hypothetical protein
MKKSGFHKYFLPVFRQPFSFGLPPEKPYLPIKP